MNGMELATCPANYNKKRVEVLQAYNAHIDDDIVNIFLCKHSEFRTAENLNSPLFIHLQAVVQKGNYESGRGTPF